MTNYTPYYWAWDGTSLETYAHGIEEFTEGREELPPLRGENRVVPGANGRLHRPKVPDQRVITLTMWVNGADDNGVIIDEAAWRYNVRALKDLLWDPTNLHELSKGIPSDAVGGIVRVTADAQVTGGMRMGVQDGEQGLQIARFTVDFTLPYPYFVDGSSNEYL